MNLLKRIIWAAQFVLAHPAFHGLVAFVAMLAAVVALLVLL